MSFLYACEKEYLKNFDFLRIKCSHGKDILNLSLFLLKDKYLSLQIGK